MLLSFSSQMNGIPSIYFALVRRAVTGMECVGNDVSTISLERTESKRRIRRMLKGKDDVIAKNSLIKLLAQDSHK